MYGTGSEAHGAIQEPVLLPRVEARMAVRLRVDPVVRALREQKPIKFCWRRSRTLRPSMNRPIRIEKGWKVSGKAFAGSTPWFAPVGLFAAAMEAYQAELVCFEELMRTAPLAKGGPGRDRISELARTLESERLLAQLPNSVENTFATNVLTGGAIDPGADRPEFLKFWEAARSSESAKYWDSLAASDIPQSFDRRPSLKIQPTNTCSDWLLRIPRRT